MKTVTTTLSVGVQTPFSILHISDTHLTLADGRDDERKRLLAQDRARIPEFAEASAVLEETARLAARQGLPVVHTGDIIDFVSYANLDAAKRFVDQTGCILAAGNHEFSRYLGEAWEDAAYRNQSLGLVQRAFRNDIRFSSTVINGVNFVGIDNSYYLIEPEQLKALAAQAQREYPIILLLHTPLYAADLYAYKRGLQENDPAYLMNVPADEMAYYPPDRVLQQTADKTTAEAYDFIVHCPQIKAILTGHLHFDFEGTVTPQLPQIVTGCSTVRTVNII